ncbi:hypothetical protein I552_8831 [Mycobacterium xenopi 3993]|nr:hypothetical protein I552_8831 [Mycobacterium xenopi 3993]
MALIAGLGLAGFGLAAVADAQPGPFPNYHWCPGQYWDPGWGDNWDWAAATTTGITTATRTTRPIGTGKARGIRTTGSPTAVPAGPWVPGGQPNGGPGPGPWQPGGGPADIVDRVDRVDRMGTDLLRFQRR